MYSLPLFLKLSFSAMTLGMILLSLDSYIIAYSDRYYLVSN